MIVKIIKKIGWKLIGLKYWLLNAYSIYCYNHSGDGIKDKQTLVGLKNKYEGRRAFIVCNGPSLKISDLNILADKGEISFGSNRISKVFPHTKWRPTYYAEGHTVFKELIPTINQVGCAFLPQIVYSATKSVKGNKIYINLEGKRELLHSPKFSHDCSEIVYAMGTVTYILFQLAVYMGFRELYIIGCDNRYHREIKADGTIITHNEVPNQYAGKEVNTKEAGNTWEMNIAYDAAKKYADEHGIKIYNATRGGYLETFERVDFDSLFH